MVLWVELGYGGGGEERGVIWYRDGRLGDPHNTYRGFPESGGIPSCALLPPHPDPRLNDLLRLPVWEALVYGGGSCGFGKMVQPLGGIHCDQR